MIGIGIGVPFNQSLFGSAPSFPNTKSLLFDGVDEDVTTTNISALQNVSAFSVSAWIKIGTDGNFTLLRRYLSASNATIPVFYDSSASKLEVLIYKGSSSTGEYNWTPSLNTWYHIVATYDGSGATDADKVKLYIDGVNVTLSFTSTMPTTTANTSGTYEITRFRTDGNADEISIFNYALSSTQVTSLYNSGTPTDLDNTSGVTAPVHWWRMGDGDTYPTITDVGTTGGNNGTMTNMESGDIVTDTP